MKSRRTRYLLTLCAAVTLAVAAPFAVHSKTLCTVIADAASGKLLTEQGDCRTRVTPASTFKIPLAVMGFDAGILQDAHAPTLPFRAGYADWGGDNWKQPTDPARWMQYSVVWYSRVITHQLGTQRLENYAKDFGFGNADFSGDPGQNNGLDRAWIISSLKISPLEQIAFLTRLVNRQLPEEKQVGEFEWSTTRWRRWWKPARWPTARVRRARPAWPTRARPTAASTRRAPMAGSSAGRLRTAELGSLRG